MAGSTRSGRGWQHVAAAALVTGAVFGSAPASAQERRAEQAELEAMLERVEAALAALEPVNEPPMRLAQYDVRGLQYLPYERDAPPLTLPSEGAGHRTAAGGGFTFADEEPEGVVLDADQVTALATAAVGGEEAWEDPASIEWHNGYLFVRQTEVAHARIRRALEELRRTVRSVQVEVLFYALADAAQRALEDRAAAAGGLLDARALADLDALVAREPARLTGDGILSALSGQRVALHQGEERSFLSDWEQSSGGTGPIVDRVSDPILEVLRTGVSLDVRATVLGEGAAATVALDVRFTQARLLELATRRTPWGVLEEPRVAVDSVRTSARVPPGAGMLVFSARGAGNAETLTIVARPRLLGP